MKGPIRATYWAEVEESGLGDPGHMGDLENFKRSILEHILSYVRELEDGDTVTFTFGRRDMSKQEEDAIPEI